MAAPQVCGLGALYLQLNPKLTPAELKVKLLADTTAVVYSTGLDNDYTDNRSISNGIPRFMYQKFNSPNPYEMTGITLSGMSLRLA
jgi:hypothetical protein